MTDGNAQDIWNRLTKKTGLREINKITKKPSMGTHSLRKYFKTNFKDPYYAKWLMGQSTKTDKSYDLYTETKIDEEYIKNSKDLFIFSMDLETKEKVKLKQEKYLMVQHKISNMLLVVILLHCIRLYHYCYS